jgi:hypothetical protein
MIVGINNVYTFCNGGTPTVLFAYYYSTGGTVKTSPTISLNGTQIAFIESLAGGSIAATSRLHVLTVGTTGTNGTVAHPCLPGAGGGTGCTSNNATDVVRVLYNSSPTVGTERAVTRSSVFVDYNTNNGYVGDDPPTTTGNGFLHQFTNVFNTPAATTALENISAATCGTTGVACLSGGFPMRMTGSGLLTAPVYDPISENVFVGGAMGLVFYVLTSGSTTGFCANGGATPCVGGFTDGGTGTAWEVGNNEHTGVATGFGNIYDPALIDITAGMTFWESGAAFNGTCTPNLAPVFFQTNTAFLLASTGGICFGNVGNVNNMHQGQFDNAYYTSPASGHLWISPNDVAATTGKPALGYLTFATGSVINGGLELGIISSGQVDASPISENYDLFTSTDWITVGLPNDSCSGSTNGGCVFAYNGSPAVINSGFTPWVPSQAFGNGAEIVDTNGNLQKVVSLADAGTSFTAPPAVWNVAGTTLDGTPAEASGFGYVVTNNIAYSPSTAATASFSFTAQPESNYSAFEDDLYFPGIYIAGILWDFDCGSGSTGSAPCAATDYYNDYNTFGEQVILIGDTLAHTVQNIVAAINNAGQGACGYTDPTAGDGVLYHTCYYPPVSQTYLTATAASPAVDLQANVYGTGGNGTGNCYLNYGFEPEDTYEGTGVNAEKMSPFARTCLSGGTGSAPPTISVDAQAISASEPAVATATGTFSANPTGGQVEIVNGSNFAILTPSLATAASATGKVLGTAFTQGQTVSITNGANSETVIASTSTPATATATIQVDPASGKTVTINNTANAGGTTATLTSSSNAATGTITFSAKPNANDTITIGTITYEFETSVANCTGISNCVVADQNGTASRAENRTGYNLTAAINFDEFYCYDGPPCFANLTVPNPSVYVAAEPAANVVTVTNRVPGLQGAATAFSKSSTVITLAPASGGINGTVANSATVFVTGGTPIGDATNLTAAINLTAASVGASAVQGTGLNGATPNQVVVTASGTNNQGLLGNNVIVGGSGSTGSVASGTFTFSGLPTGSFCADGDYVGFEIGANIYRLASLTDTTSSPNCYAYAYATYNDVTVLIGDTAAHTAQNLAAAINASPQPTCGYTDPNTTDVSYGTCYGQDQADVPMASNAYVMASVSGSTVTLWSRVTGTGGNCAAGTPYPGNCFGGYGWAELSTSDGYTDLENITPTYGGNTGAAGTSSNIGWSCGTPPCDMAGGSNTASNTGVYFDVTSGIGSTIATNLANALIRNVGSVAVTTGAASGGSFTTTANVAGSGPPGGNTIAVGGTAVGANFAWQYSGISTSHLQGGANGSTTASTFAVDGVLFDDASALAAAINLNTSANGDIQVAATCTGYPTCTALPITLTASNPGTGGNSIQLYSSATGFDWNSSTGTPACNGSTSPCNMGGGSSGTTSGTTFAFWGPTAELNAGEIAANMVYAINNNTTLQALFPGIMATNTSGSGCSSNCEFTINATSNGVVTYGLTTSFAVGTFYWNCPAGTSSSAMCGGSNGVIWTYQSASNGETAVARSFGTSGMIMETLDHAPWQASHAYAESAGVTDSHGNNQFAVRGGTSGATVPAWNAAVGGFTTDGTGPTAITWENVGPAAAANLYLGTLTGAGANAAVKYAVLGLQ